MRRDHEVYQYRDGYKTIQYCRFCGKEGIELFDACEPIEQKCSKCGHLRYTNVPCENCERIQKLFKDAIDNKNSRN